MRELRRNRFYLLAMVALLSQAVWSGGCYYDNEEDLYPGNTCDTTAVTYSGDIEPIIDASCAIPGCHVAGGAGNGIFENYAGVKDKVDNGSMRARVVNLRDMPPDNPITDCQVELFRAWLNAGAPNN